MRGVVTLSIVAVFGAGSGVVLPVARAADTLSERGEPPTTTDVVRQVFSEPLQRGCAQLVAWLAEGPRSDSARLTEALVHIGLTVRDVTLEHPDGPSPRFAMTVVDPARTELSLSAVRDTGGAKGHTLIISADSPLHSATIGGNPKLLHLEWSTAGTSDDLDLSALRLLYARSSNGELRTLRTYGTTRAHSPLAEYRAVENALGRPTGFSAGWRAWRSGDRTPDPVFHQRVLTGLSIDGRGLAQGAVCSGGEWLDIYSVRHKSRWGETASMLEVRRNANPLSVRSYDCDGIRCQRTITRPFDRANNGRLGRTVVARLRTAGRIDEANRIQERMR